MRNNQNYYKILEEDICCCPTEQCECKSSQNCGDKAKTAWDRYLEAEKCKTEIEVEYNICDYNPDQVYFMQYLSPRSLYNKEFTENGIKNKEV